MLRSLANFVVPMSLVAAVAVPLVSRPALAAGDIPDQTARDLSKSNPTVLSNPAFTKNPDLGGQEGSYGGAVGTRGSGTEYYPPGANGPEATGSMANGSMMGQFGS